MNQRFHIAQLNVARARYGEDDPRIAEFYAKLDEVNELAENSPGFVWRLQGESGNATEIEVDGDPLLLVNMSVWTTVEHLYDFVYRTIHRDVMAKRRSWFERPDDAYQVLWWVAPGTEPTVDQAMQRLEALRRNGPSGEAFNFQAKHPPPDQAGGPEDMQPDRHCIGWD